MELPCRSASRDAEIDADTAAPFSPPGVLRIPATGYRFWEPNVTKTIVSDDRWYRVEWYVKWESSPGAGDGIVRWWVDGVLNGDYRTVPFPPIKGFVEYQHAPSLQNTPPAEQYMFIDHTYVSAP